MYLHIYTYTTIKRNVLGLLDGKNISDDFLTGPATFVTELLDDDDNNIVSDNEEELGQYGMSSGNYSKHNVVNEKAYECEQQRISDLHQISHDDDKIKYFHESNKNIFINKSDGTHKWFIDNDDDNHKQSLNNDDSNQNERYPANNDDAIYDNNNQYTSYQGKHGDDSNINQDTYNRNNEHYESPHDSNVADGRIFYPHDDNEGSVSNVSNGDLVYADQSDNTPRDGYPSGSSSTTSSGEFSITSYTYDNYSSDGDNSSGYSCCSDDSRY